MDKIDTIVYLFITLPTSYDNVVTSLETLTLAEEKKLIFDFIKIRLLDQKVKIRNQH